MRAKGAKGPPGYSKGDGSVYYEGWDKFTKGVVPVWGSLSIPAAYGSAWALPAWER